MELFETTDERRMHEAFAIRTAVFVDEQAVPADEEIDAHDLPGAHAVHAVVREGDRAIATGRFYDRGAASVQIGRMAVLRDERGRGVGRVLLRALMREARRRGFRLAHLHAQLHARAFYVRHGFADDGERLWDAKIEHQPMSAVLEDYGTA